MPLPMHLSRKNLLGPLLDRHPKIGLNRVEHADFNMSEVSGFETLTWKSVDSQTGHCKHCNPHNLVERFSSLPRKL